MTACFNLGKDLGSNSMRTLTHVADGLADDDGIGVADVRPLGDKLQQCSDRLSGGQQQRVAIARSLAMRPRVMLFDEVTSALDPELTQEVLVVLERLARGGMTMLLVTHEMGFARRVASTTIFMHQGRIWEQGPSHDPFEHPQTPEMRQFIRADVV
jgi:polar amino acid transport system ATP-binding protein